MTDPFHLPHLKRSPDYWEEACDALSTADPIMARMIADFEGERLTGEGEPFTTLLRSIVGQQISTKAADAIWFRLVALLENLSPQAILAVSFDELRKVGLSARKVEYVTDLARHFLSGEVDVNRWDRLSDDELVQELTAIRGIGRWTVEMLMIFCLLRPDVFPVDDIGLQKAIVTFYPEIQDGDQKLAPKVFRVWGERWKPWRTVATWYLWRSLDPGPIAY